MQLSRRAVFVIAVSGLLLGCASGQAAATDQPDLGALSAPEHDFAQATPDHDGETATEGENHHDEEHSTPHESAVGADGESDGTETASREGGGEHGDAGGHESDGHGGADPLHLFVEALQIVLAFVAVGSVVLASRIYGGEIGRALLVSGAGVTLFALERLWHNLHELGLLGSPSALGRQGLFILATGALAAGYLFLYQTMNKRMG